MNTVLKTETGSIVLAAYKDDKRHHDYLVNSLDRKMHIISLEIDESKDVNKATFELLGLAIEWFRERADQHARKNVYFVVQISSYLEFYRKLGWKMIRTEEHPDDYVEMGAFDTEYAFLAYPLGDQLDQEEEVGPEDYTVRGHLGNRYPHPELIHDWYFDEFVEECCEEETDPLEALFDLCSTNGKFDPVEGYHLYVKRIKEAMTRQHF